MSAALGKDDLFDPQARTAQRLVSFFGGLGSFGLGGLMVYMSLGVRSLGFRV